MTTPSQLASALMPEGVGDGVGIAPGVGVGVWPVGVGVWVGVGVGLAEVVGVGVDVLAPVTVRQFENCEVSLLAFVAVAVMTSPVGTLELTVWSIVAVPDGEAVTVKLVR